MKTRRLAAFAAAILLVIPMLCLPASAEELIIDAPTALLVERTSGTVLYAKQEDEKIYPASLTKIMTCLLALEHGNLQDVLTVSQTALTDLSESGSTADMQVGEMMTLEHMLYCMMVSSANEASNVIAEYIAGSVNAFVTMMNARALELGCTGTHFANTHGLHDDDHYTTANDLRMIVEAALAYPKFRAIVSTVSYTVPVTNLSEERHIRTTNHLLDNALNNPYYYKKASGVKTGYTSSAGRCLIATASDGKLELLSIVCGAETVILETGDLLLKNFPETVKLLDYGFEGFTLQTVLSTLYPVEEMRVRGAAAEYISLAPAEEIRALLPNDYDEALLSFDITLSNEDGVDAPVFAGDELGSVTAFYDGKELGKTALCAVADVPRTVITQFIVTSVAYAADNFFMIALLLIFSAVLLLLLFLVIQNCQRKRFRKKQEKLRRIQQNALRRMRREND